MSNTTKCNFSQDLIRDIFLNSSVLSSLIFFLRENDKKFKNFELISHISLSRDLTKTHEKNFYDALNECIKLPIEKIPDVEEFRKMVQTNSNDKKFMTGLIHSLLKAVIFEHKLTSTLGLIAYIIINKDKIDKSHQLNK